MTGQMCWLSKFGGNGELILHLRFSSHHSWKRYTHFVGVAVADYPIPGGSKGFATSQKLLMAGWSLLSKAEVRASFNSPSQAA